MKLFDINVLVYAYRDDTPEHQAYRRWLFNCVQEDEPFALAGVVLSGFSRIVSNPRIFRKPTPIGEALVFCAVLREQPHSAWIHPGPRHWDIFEGLCRRGGAKGNLVSGAYLAALAIEWGCELITADRDFARFPGFAGGIRWKAEQSRGVCHR